MTKRLHGITSLGLVAVATVIAAIAMFQTSWVLGVVYLALCAVSLLSIVYAYCAKCPCKERCAHVFLGRAAMSFNRQPGPYSTAELTALILSLLLLLGFPQFWLWRYTGLFVAYWVLSGIALVQVRIVVCRTCENVYCSLKGEGE